MEPQQHSRTAFLVAGYRARATEWKAPIFNDPWASGLSGQAGRDLCRQADVKTPDLELCIALRTRYIDDCVVAAIARGISQIVILGAGLDTRAARFGREGVRFFEVDRPASQAAKRRNLTELPGYPIDAATYVECDFETDDLVEQLDDAGLNRDEPVLFVWEGVVCYLEEPAARKTLRQIATCFHPDSAVVFDYIDIEQNKRLESSKAREDAAALEQFLESLDEPFPLGLDPRKTATLAAEEGFRYMRTVSFAELCLEQRGLVETAMDFHMVWISVVSVGDRLAGALP